MDRNLGEYETPCNFLGGLASNGLSKTYGLKKQFISLANISHIPTFEVKATHSGLLRENSNYSTTSLIFQWLIINLKGKEAPVSPYWTITQSFPLP